MCTAPGVFSRRPLIVAALCALAALSSSRAAGQAYEGFDYPGGVGVGGQNGGTGWTVAWGADLTLRVGGPTLTHANALPSTGLAARNTGASNAARELKPGVGDMSTPGRSWLSFLLERDQAGEATTLTMNGLFVDPLHLLVAPDNTVSIQYGGGIPSVSTVSASGPNITDLYLIHLGTQAGLATIDLWVNPPPTLGAPTASVSSPLTSLNYGNVDYFMGIHQVLDEIRTGATVDQVCAIPSPAPAALLGLAGLTFARRRYRVL